MITLALITVIAKLLAGDDSASHFIIPDLKTRIKLLIKDKKRAAVMIATVNTTVQAGKIYDKKRCLFYPNDAKAGALQRQGNKGVY